MQGEIILSHPELEYINWKELKEFVENLSFKLKEKEDFLYSLKEKKIPEFLAKIRILSYDKKELNENPYPVEIDYEKRNLQRKERKKGVIYSGLHFQKFLQENLSPDELNFKKKLTVYISDQLLASFEYRWHLRVIFLGFPVIISIPGMVEAPAREKEYYISQAITGISVVEPENYLEEKDKRTTSVLKGYLLQAIIFWRSIINKIPFRFCEKKDCALYNSHWQREMLIAQKNHTLCKSHLEILKV